MDKCPHDWYSAKSRARPQLLLIEFCPGPVTSRSPGDALSNADGWVLLWPAFKMREGLASGVPVSGRGPFYFNIMPFPLHPAPTTSLRLLDWWLHLTWLHTRSLISGRHSGIHCNFPETHRNVGKSITEVIWRSGHIQKRWPQSRFWPLQEISKSATVS